MAESSSSPEYTITLTEGTYDVIQRCLKRVRDAAVKAEGTATTYEDLAEELRKALELALNLQSQLLGSVMNRSGDGDITLSPDGPESIFFRYASGYHGAMILHDADSPDARWSIHT